MSNIYKYKKRPYKHQVKALKNPVVLDKLKQQSAVPLGSTPAAYGAYIDAEIKRWADVVKASGVSLD